MKKSKPLPGEFYLSPYGRVQVIRTTNQFALVRDQDGKQLQVAQRSLRPETDDDN